MIPPLLLDVQPHHYVLDMCAAPGSKSVQILEALHAVDKPSGLFIANDADYKRCHMLVHQSLGRIGSPNMMVMNQDASMFVSIKKTAPDGSLTTLKFDRILTDVPCSGDATLRKNLAIWSSKTCFLCCFYHPFLIVSLHRMGYRRWHRSSSVCLFDNMYSRRKANDTYQTSTPHLDARHSVAQTGWQNSLLHLFFESYRKRSRRERRSLGTCR